MSIQYTLTDEAPALATYSLLPIIKAFVKPAAIDITTPNISLAARILAQFPESLAAAQKQADDLAMLGQRVKQSDANIIKLPNISASIPQLKKAIKELQHKGFKVPNYPDQAVSTEDQAIAKRYAKVLGSAVNPVLREGNSDRRSAEAVKGYAKAHPHRMGQWHKNSKTRVASMAQGDFFGSEQSCVVKKDTMVSIVLQTDSGETLVQKDNLSLEANELIDCAVMNTKQLQDFFSQSIGEAKQQGLLLSLHLKATMMKISDPIIFGHAVAIYFSALFDQFGEDLSSLGVDPKNGMGDLLQKIKDLSPDLQEKVQTCIDQVYQDNPPLAMVNSDLGITNLHVPSDVIIDASMPAAIRSSGQMWGPDGQLHDTLMMIPDRSYATIYQEVIDFCRTHGAFDVSTMGSVANVGLMAQKAEEYGSHDKTFVMSEAGTCSVIDEQGQVLLSQSVDKGDIWRMCQTKDIPISNWVELAVTRAQLSETPVVFWLDPKRAHDAQLIDKVNHVLAQLDTKGCDVQILSPQKAMHYTLTRCRDGQNTIAATGNVLRDYLTDLFPILELGTSAKMLSIVPLLAGGGLYETGAGGSAPKHVEQMLEEGHLRWDSLGEFLALGVSLEDLGRKTNNAKAMVLAQTLNEGIGVWLENNRSPQREAGQLDNRGSHFYLALYWAEALATQNQDQDLKTAFADFAQSLKKHEDLIVQELNEVQGQPVDLGGYYHPDPELAEQAMRPSQTFNDLVDQF